MLSSEAKAENRSRYMAILLQNALKDLDYPLDNEQFKQIVDTISHHADLLVLDDEQWAEREKDRKRGL